MDLSFISEFVRGTSRLILPDLGAFLVKDFESGFDLKNVTFSTFLRYQDSTFTTLLAEKFSLSPQDAGEKARLVIAHIEQELKKNQRCALPGLGALTVLKDGQIAFQPGEGIGAEDASKDNPMKVNSPAETIPLITSMEPTPAQKPSFPSEKMDATSPSATRTPGENPKSGVPTPPQKPPTAAARKAGQRPKYVKREDIKKGGQTKNQPRKAIAPAEKSEKGGSSAGKALLFCILLIAVLFAIDFLWVGLVTPRFFPDKAPYFAKKSPEPPSQSVTADVGTIPPVADSSAAQLEHTDQSETDFSEEFSRRTDNQTPPQNAAAPAQKEEAPKAAAQANRYSAPSSLNSYHLVVGSFEIESNATRFSAQLKQEGLESSVLNQPSGMHAVTIGSFSSLADAKAELQEMRQRYPNVWILHL